MMIYNVVDVYGSDPQVVYSSEKGYKAEMYCGYLNSLNLKYSTYAVQVTILEDMRVSFLFYGDSIEVVNVHDTNRYEDDADHRIDAVTLSEAKQIIEDNK